MSSNVIESAKELLIEQVGAEDYAKIELDIDENKESNTVRHRSYARISSDAVNYNTSTKNSCSTVANSALSGLNNDVVVAFNENQNITEPLSINSGTINIAGTDITLKGTSGTDYLKDFKGQSTVLEGEAGNDIISVAGGNNQVLTGNEGSDVYKVLSAIKSDTRITIDQQNAGLSDRDSLQLVKVAKEDVSYVLQGKDLQIIHKNGGQIVIQDWYNTPVNTISFNNGVMKSADIKALLAPVKENIINVDKDTLVGTNMIDRFVLPQYRKVYNPVIENYAREDVIDCTSLLNGLSADHEIVISVDKNKLEKDGAGDDLQLWFEVKNTKTGQFVDRYGDIVLKDFFADASFGTVNINDELVTVVGKNANLSWSASENNSIYFIGNNINAVIENYNADTFIDISSVINYEVGKASSEKSGNDLVLHFKDETNAEASSLTFVDYYVKNIKPHIRINENYDTILAAGTDGVDNIKLNNLYTEKDAEGLVYCAGAGNDVITADKGNYYISAGAGDDTIKIQSAGNEVGVDGTSGQNNISISGASDVFVIAGEGKGDIIDISDSEYVEVRGKAGRDTITINNAEDIFVSGGAGDDKIIANNFEYADLEGGLGNDIYDLDWSNASNIYLDQNNSNEIGSTIQEQDKLILRGAKFNDLEFRRYHYNNNDYGNHWIEIYSSDIFNYINKDKCLSVQNVENNMLESITLDDGVLNFINVKDTSESVKDYSSLEQGVFIVNDSEAKLEIKGSNHNDYVEIRNDNDIVHGNAGDDYITDFNIEDRGMSGAKLFGDAGNDKIYVSNGDNYTIEGGAGDDYIKIASGTKHTVDGGAGNDVYKIEGWLNNSDTCFVICQESAAKVDKDSLIIEQYSLDELDFKLYPSYETSSGTKNNVLCIENKSNGGRLLVTDWQNHPLAKLNIGGIVLSTNDVNAILEGMYANKICTIEFTNSYQNVYVPQNWQYDTIRVLGANADGSDSMFKLEGGNLQIKVRSDSSSAIHDDTLGVIYVNNVQSTGLQQIVIGEGSTASVIKVIGDGANASYTGTSSIDGYLFVGTGWQINVSDLQRPDCLDFSAYRDASSVRYKTVKSGNDLQLTAFYYDNEDVVHTYGTVTLKNYFADSNGDGTADGNAAGIRVKTAYRYNGYYYDDEPFVTTWERLYVDTSNKDLDFDVKAYMGTVNERPTAIGNKSARGIFFSSGSGNDVITAGEGRDYISTGAGDDTVYVKNKYYGTEEYIADAFSEATKDQIFTGDGNDKVYIGTYDEQNDTSAKCNSNYVRTGAGADYIEVRGDDNNIGSGSGDDTIRIHGGRNRVNAGDGNDTVLLWSSGMWNNQHSMTGGENVSYDNRIYGGAGDDTIYVRRGQNDQSVWGDAGNDTYVVQYNRATDLTINQASAAEGDSDKLVLMGVDTSNLADISLALEDGQLRITGTADRWWNSFSGGEYTFHTGLNVNITIEGWLDSELESIELVDIDNNRTLTYSGNAITEAVQNAMTSFKDIAVDSSTNTIGATEQEQLNTLKLYSNTCDPKKTSL